MRFDYACAQGIGKGRLRRGAVLYLWGGLMTKEKSGLLDLREIIDVAYDLSVALGLDIKPKSELELNAWKKTLEMDAKIREQKQ